MLIDATVVRMLLVPALMVLMGKANWWLPRWLDRILPRVHVDGPEDQSRPGPGDTLPETPRHHVSWCPPGADVSAPTA